MTKNSQRTALIAHGGAGARVLAANRTARRRAIILAVERGAAILRGGGSALDAVVATVMALEDHPMFNAGVGSVLNVEGEVEMDASVAVAAQGGHLGMGGVGAVSRVRNPIALARAVMEYSPHILLVGRGAERLARKAGVARCRRQELVTEAARRRWRAYLGASQSERKAGAATVGAVAVDCRGELAAATSTGGITGKMVGRVGDSALVGAGTFASPLGAASATGRGEEIMKFSLCRDAVKALSRMTAWRAASRAIAAFGARTGTTAGIVMVDRQARIGYAHNAAAMEIALLSSAGAIRHEFVEPLVCGQGPRR